MRRVERWTRGLRGTHWDVTLLARNLGSWSVHSDMDEQAGADHTLTVNVIPEPAGFLLLTAGILGLRKPRRDVASKARRERHAG